MYVWMIQCRKAGSRGQWLSAWFGSEDDAVRFRDRKVAAGYEVTMPAAQNLDHEYAEYCETM